MARKKFALILLLLVIFNTESVISTERDDYYTSIAGLEYLLDAEISLLNAIENYRNKVQEMQSTISNFIDQSERNIFKDKYDPMTYFHNPFESFKLIKRIIVDWKQMQQLILYNKNVEDYILNVDKIFSKDFVNATEDDLFGASNGLVRLQSTYALETADIVDGVLMGYEYNTTLSAHDCFELGRSLYELKKFKYAIKWLQQSMIQLANEKKNSLIKDMKIEGHFPYLTKVDILNYLAPSMYKIGNIKLASMLNEEILGLEPNNAQGLVNKKNFEEKIIFQRLALNNTKEIYQAQGNGEEEIEEEEDEDDEEEKDESYVEKIYEAVCRGDIKQSPSEQRHLRCRYTTKNVPYRLIAPFKMEELHHEPFVAVYHNAIYDNEMERIIRENEDFVERSGIDDMDEGGVEVKYTEFRTSKNTWLEYDEHKFLKPIRQRLHDITGLNFQTAEPLQVANYGIGGHYGPHYDFSNEPDITYPGQGNRILTALFYINEPELGGSTAFPFLRLAVPSTKGSLLVWFNVHQSLEPDYRTSHAGCPVLKGSKWICNEWFHQVGQELNMPCSLERQGHISLPYTKLV